MNKNTCRTAVTSVLPSFFSRALNSSAFTLIELLVVVLIIGILASVALPQYSQAVERSRATEALIMTKAIAEANRRHFLETGAYTYQIEDLDIEIPGADSTFNEWNRKQSQYFEYGAHGQADGSIAVANRLPRSSFYSINIYEDGSAICAIYENNKGARVCSYLGTYVSDNKYQIN